jgi:hypothetical protein
MRLSVLIGCTVLVVTPASGQETISGDTGGGSSAAAERRPLMANGFRDEIVTQARDLLEKRCPTAPYQPCEEIRQEFVAGGDDLAAYFVAQWKAGIAEGWFPDYGMLSYMAYTDSETAYEYLRQLVEASPELAAVTGETGLTERNVRYYALRGLGRHRDPRALDLLIRDLDSAEDDLTKLVRLGGIQRHMTDTGTKRPALARRLARLQGRGGKVGKRAAELSAWLAARGLLADD